MTNVYITIDTECREERNVRGDDVMPAAGYDLRVWGRFKNQTEAFGIPWIMQQLDTHQLPGVFYVDPIGTLSFGKAEFAAVCEEILTRGHDVQLHLHPIQRNARYHSSNVEPNSDFLCHYSLEQQVSLLREGLNLLVEAGVPRSQLVAFRSGHFASNPDTWRALVEVGLRFSSNYNPCYFNQHCHLQRSSLANDAFEPIPGLFELPITNLVQDDGNHRHLQVTAISGNEMCDALDQAHAEGIQHVNIVTHSFEFCHIDSTVDQLGRPNRVNMRRFQQLARFLVANKKRFNVKKMTDIDLLPLARDAENGDCQAKFPKSSKYRRWARYVGQAGKRLDASFGQLLG